MVEKTSAPYFILPSGFFIHSHTWMQSQSFLIFECLFHNGTAKNSLKFCLEWKKKRKMMPHSPLAQHATRWRVDVCVCMCIVCACVSDDSTGVEALWVTEKLIDKRRLTGAESQWGPRERTFSRWWSQTPWTPVWWSPPRPPLQWWWRGSAH